MAKAVFHKHQRVFVKPVGTWAMIEHVKPHWVRDVEEPVKVAYCCGLGRDFTADELAVEQSEDFVEGRWRLMRAKNKWQSAEECARHPYPGTFPVVVTDEADWGGWRVPAAEYDRDPDKMETQARLISNAPQLLALAAELKRLASEQPDMPADLAELAQQAADIIRSVEARPQGGASRRADAA